MSLMALHEMGHETIAESPLVGVNPAQPAPEETALFDAVEVYHRTYTTILRSSGETQLRVFEHSHKAMGSSLHPLAASPELDLGALLYAIRRLPDAIFSARRVVMGQSAEVFAQRGFSPFSDWSEVSAPGRRRRSPVELDPEDRREVARREEVALRARRHRPLCHRQIPDAKVSDQPRQ